MKTNKFWSYLMTDGRVYPLGDFDEDFNTAWPQVWDAAKKIAAEMGAEPAYALNETDLVEISQHVQDCFNTKQILRGADYYLIGAFIDKEEIDLIRKLVEQYPDCEFLESVLCQCNNVLVEERN